jgi:hypothetical protein
MLMVLLSMLKQKTTFNYKVVLVLSSDEFQTKEQELPPKLIELANVCDYFEILWTKENTKAYKKYFPVRRKYPDENICILDDDSTLHDNFVESFCTLLKQNPDRMIIGTNHFLLNNSKTIVHTRFGAACFRPNSLYDLDENFGRRYFLDHDDEFYLFLSVLNGTKSVCLDIHKYIDINRFQQDKCLANVGGQLRYNNLESMWAKCFNENPELKDRYNKNKEILN